MRSRARSEALDPRAQLDFPGPSATRLPEDVQVGLSDRIRIEHRIVRVDTTPRPYRSIEHELRDVDTFRRELARHALGQAAQRELPHRKRRRLRIALDAGGG